MHGCALYEGRASDDSRGRVPRRERARQERLIESLGADRAEVARDQRLVAAWDAMSLALCLEWDDYEVEASTLSRAGDRVTVRPWPFTGDELSSTARARRLTSASLAEAAMHARSPSAGEHARLLPQC